VLFVFAPLFVAEAGPLQVQSRIIVSYWALLYCIVLIPIITVPNILPSDYTLALYNFVIAAVPTFYFTSLAITLMATALIIYRIVSVVQQSDSESSRYKLTLEALLESGGLYAASLAALSFLYVAQGHGPITAQFRMHIAESFWQQGVIPPITVRAACII
jgi:hypothetical protein